MWSISNTKCVFENLVISEERFVPWDVLSSGLFIPGTFFPWDLMSWDVLSWDVLSLGTFCLCTPPTPHFQDSAESQKVVYK